MAATPGPWLRNEEDGRFIYAINDNGLNRFCACVQDAHTPVMELVATAKHIATFSPDLVLRMLAVIEAAEKAMEFDGSQEDFGALFDALAALQEPIKGEVK